MAIIDVNAVITQGSSTGGASTIGDFGLFNSALPPTSGFLRQGTGPYNISDYPTLGNAYAIPTFTSTAGQAAASTAGSVIEFGAGLFVTLFNSSTTYQTSPDGITWTVRTNLPVGINWGGLKWNGSLFVATGVGSSVILTSTNGTTWTQRALPAALNYYNISWNGSVWCVVSYNNNIVYTSPDAITWTLRTLPINTTWYAIAANTTTGLFVILEYGGSRALTSTDNGATWTVRTLPFASNWYDIEFGNGLFVAVSISSTAAITSVDGNIWTQRSLNTSLGCYSVRYNGTYWLALASGAQVSTSKDGNTWTVRATSNTFNSSEQALATNGNLFVWNTVGNGAVFVRASLTTPTTFNVPAVTEPSGFQYWVMATASSSGGSSSSGLTLGSVQTASFTALPNYEYPINTSSGAVTMTMPASPVAGQRVCILDYANKFNTNNLTLNANGSKFAGNSGNVTVSSGGASICLIYVDTTQGWVPETYSVWGSVFGVVLTGDALTASALTTSLAAFNAAGANGVVEITQAEYNNLKAISNTAIMAASDAIMSGATLSGTNGADYVTAYNIPLTSGGKIVGFSLAKAATGANVFQIWTSATAVAGGTATKIYQTSTITNSGFYYFVIKTPIALGNNLYLGTNNFFIASDLTSSGIANVPAGVGAYGSPPSSDPETLTNSFNAPRYPLIQLLNRTT